jgi:hypothetical protein
MSGKEVEIIGILSSSQGKIAVVSALLAGIGYTVLTSITSDEILHFPYLSFLFILSSTTVVTGNIFVAIICSMSEQEGEIAQAMSILRDSRSFDLQLEKWWQKFSPLRTQSVWIFYFSVPFLFLSISLISLIKWPSPYSYLVSGLFLLFGSWTTQQIFWLSSIFRSDVLLIETFQEMKYNTKLKRVLSQRDSSRYYEGERQSPPPTPTHSSVTETISNSRGRKESSDSMKRMKSFHFQEEEEEEPQQPREQSEVEQKQAFCFHLPQTVSHKQNSKNQRVIEEQPRQSEGEGQQGCTDDLLSVESNGEDESMATRGEKVNGVPALTHRKTTKKKRRKK